MHNGQAWLRNTIEIYNRLKGFAAPQRKIKVKLPA